VPRMQSAKPLSGKTGILVGVIVWFGLSAILILHARYYMPFLSDDSLISLRYLQRFLHGEGLTWTAGRPVEGYSNLLWILLLAIPGAFGADLVTAARVVGTGCAIMVIASVLWCYSRDRAPKPGWMALTAGLLFYCLAAPTAVWAIGGLEQPLCALLLSVTIPLGFSIIESRELELKRTLAASLMLGLLCLARPDGPVFAAALFLALVSVWGITESRRRLRMLLALVSVPLLCYAGQTIFRLYYYGEPVANATLVKFTPSQHHLLEGLRYVAGGVTSLAPFSYIAVIYLIASLWFPSTRKRSVLLLLFAALWTAYLIVIGGDVFPAYRHFVPLIVVFTFALIEAIAAAYAFCKAKKFLAWVVALLLVVLFAVYGPTQFRHIHNQMAKKELWEWDGQVLGLFLKKAFGQQAPLIAVTAAGCIPYWSELPSLDMLGLNDYYLPRHPPKDLGQGHLGHEFGDGKYVIDQKPDIIIFHAGGFKPVFRGGTEMILSGDLVRLYAPVNVLGTFPRAHRATIWVRKESEKIGIRRRPDEIEIPGFLLDIKGDPAAQLNGENQLVVPVSSKAPGKMEIPAPSSGNWTCEAVSRNPQAADCQLTQTDSTMRILVTTTSSVPVEIEKVLLKKVP
jgi:arabinofuranosyltransferase